MKEKNNTFEENLKELEDIAIQLERGNLDLEKSIDIFEKGIKISKECTKYLDNAEKRINILVENESGIKEEKFDIDE
jgi:exodeoxyribonuclease VII small subunit